MLPAFADYSAQLAEPADGWPVGRAGACADRTGEVCGEFVALDILALARRANPAPWTSMRPATAGTGARGVMTMSW